MCQQRGSRWQRQPRLNTISLNEATQSAFTTDTDSSLFGTSSVGLFGCLFTSLCEPVWMKESGVWGCIWELHMCLFFFDYFFWVCFIGSIFASNSNILQHTSVYTILLHVYVYMPVYHCVFMCVMWVTYLFFVLQCCGPFQAQRMDGASLWRS